MVKDSVGTLQMHIYQRQHNVKKDNKSFISAERGITQIMHYCSVKPWLKHWPAFSHAHWLMQGRGCLHCAQIWHFMFLVRFNLSSHQWVIRYCFAISAVSGSGIHCLGLFLVLAKAEHVQRNQIFHSLTQHNISDWLDEWGLSPGQNYNSWLTTSYLNEYFKTCLHVTNLLNVPEK